MKSSRRWAVNRKNLKTLPAASCEGPVFMMNIHIYIHPDGEVVITDLVGDLLPLAQSLIHQPEEEIESGEVSEKA